MSGIEGLLRGRTLAGRYHIEEVIGRGGMGAVYRARDERLGRRVAVKVVALSGSDGATRERLRSRFQREARSAAALPHHPNVVPVYDYGTDSDLGLDFLVMELLRGEDLASYFQREGAPSLATGIRILHAAARGVAVGHRAGMIHRDVKPGNIFLARAADGDAQVRILDFGIAKLVDDDTLQQLTQDGRVPHSPAFASPEQLRGLADLNPASDVFGLGAVGFQLLTGQRPFTEVDRNRMALGMSVPVPSLRELNPAIPTEVEAIVRKALAHDPRDRFADAGKMSAALGDALRRLSDQPVDPYAAVPLPSTETTSPDTDDVFDDDRTRVLDDDSGDETLLAPAQPAPPALDRAGRQAGPTRTAFPRREPPPKRSNRLFVWTLLLLLIGAGAVFAWLYFDEQGRGVEEVPEQTMPELPDQIEIEPEEEPVPLDQEMRGDPDELDAALFDLDGRRFAGLQQFDSAAIQFRRAVEISPENPVYRYNLGVALSRLRRPAEAAEEFQRAISFGYSDEARAFYNLGLAQLAIGDTTVAITSFNQVVSRGGSTQLVGAAERLLRQIRAARTQTAPITDTIMMPSNRDPESEPADTILINPARTDTARGARRDSVRRDSITGEVPVPDASGRMGQATRGYGRGTPHT